MTLVVQAVGAQYPGAKGAPGFALQAVTFTAAQGELTALLGPSGCGKSTLLRVIAGLHRPTSGSIQCGDTVWDAPGVHIATHQRHVGLVPQNGALLPHLSVYRNIEFGLKSPAQRMASGERRRRVDEVLRLVGLESFADRMPQQLSGGQQQRVALARALAPRPQVMLLDEPFAALDPTLRVGLRRELCDILAAEGVTTILVTHDHDEALSLAQRVVVLRDGAIAQDGSPQQVYAQPASTWVAEFTGDVVNVNHGGPLAARLGISSPRRLRPEDIAVALDPETPMGVVQRVEFVGHSSLISVALAPEFIADAHQSSVRARCAPAPGLRVGDEVSLRLVGTSL